MESTPKKWQTKKKAYNDAFKYLHERKEGKITSFITPWSKFNDAGISGFEWHSMIVVAARPSAGKSLWKEQLIREGFTLNPTTDFRVLDFDLEMVPQVGVIREFSSVIGKSYKYLCSAEGDGSGKFLTQDQLTECYKYAKEKFKEDGTGNADKINTVYEAPTLKELECIIDEYMEEYRKEVGKDEEGKSIFEYTKTLISIDHARLIRRDGETELDMLYRLGALLTAKKKKYPVIFIILNHLLRDVDKPERVENGKYGNYILESDIFGGDSLQQSADIVVGLNRPGKLQIQYYGPSRFIIESENVLVAHFLKVRNGDLRISFFKAEFDKMKIVEMDTPPCAKKVSKLEEQRNE